MAFSSLLCAAICASGLASWCHCAAALGNPELSGPARNAGCTFGFRPSMGPGFSAPECEIVGVGGWPPLRILRFYDLIGNAVALAISHSLFLGVEANGDLLLHVAGAGPAHQRLDSWWLLGFIIELPFPGLGGPRLHRVFGRLKDACGHGWWDPVRYAKWRRLEETAGIV